MASITFSSGTTITSTWLNDVDALVWDVFSGATTVGTARSALGLGTMALQAASAVAITGGSITGITDLVVADGGTGVSTLTGIVKGNGTSAFSAAVAGTDYVVPGAATSSSLTMATARLLGRTTASTGAIEEISVSGLTLSGGVLTGVTDGTWTDYSSSTTVAGFSSTSTKEVWYKDIGKTRFVYFNIAGTSNATNFTFTVPSAAVATGPIPIYFPLSLTADNGGNVANGIGSIALNSSTVSLLKSAGTAWTGSSTKQAAGQFTYQLP